MGFSIGHEEVQNENNDIMNQRLSISTSQRSLVCTTATTGQVMQDVGERNKSVDAPLHNPTPVDHPRYFDSRHAELYSNENKFSGSQNNNNQDDADDLEIGSLPTTASIITRSIKIDDEVYPPSLFQHPSKVVSLGSYDDNRWKTTTNPSKVISLGSYDDNRWKPTTHPTSRTAAGQETTGTEHLPSSSTWSHSSPFSSLNSAFSGTLQQLRQMSYIGYRFETTPRKIENIKEQPVSLGSSTARCTGITHPRLKTTTPTRASVPPLAPTAECRAPPHPSSSSSIRTNVPPLAPSMEIDSGTSHDTDGDGGGDDDDNPLRTKERLYIRWWLGITLFLGILTFLTFIIVILKMKALETTLTTRMLEKHR